MRPVQIGTTPATYDEAAVKAVKYVTTLSSSMSDENAIADLADSLKVLIDTWSARSFAWVGAPGAWKRDLDADAARNAELNAKYDKLQKLVGSDPDYRGARKDLLAGLGAYCSYCELPISAALAVEHRLPKAYFPALFLDWSNFLLACPICNSTKGDKPTQKIGDAYYNSDAAATRLVDLYAWPQNYWRSYPNNTDPLPFCYTLTKVAPVKGDWTSEGKVSAQDLEGLIDAYEAGLGGVQNNAFCFAGGDPADTPARQTFSYYAVGVTARPNSTTPALAAAVKNIIDVTGLNAMSDYRNQASTDFRVALRTQALFRAMSVRRAYDRLVENNMGSDLANQLMDSMVAATGFWAVWMTVFKDNPDALNSINRVFAGYVDKGWII